jgi:asparagine synthase (glutamine-hydrolysing)
MCGIAGILSLSSTQRVTLDSLRTMAAALVHRGPDDEGFHLDPLSRCGLAFRRLSIIDLATGAQPMSNESGDVWVIFNGEIYNFRELRDELVRRGHRFRTRADSEVIVHLYEEVGVDCFAKLAGMFAVALWDQRAGRLILARDRFGKKPLTYAIFDNRLYFASEAKAILSLPDAPREIDSQSIHRYLIFQYIPAPHSIYRGFAKVPPGCSLAFDAAQSPQADPTRYWTLPTAGWFDGSYDDARARLGELLTQAVEKRLIADVPLGAFLSGGIDSSIVVGLMRRLGVSPLRTFSIGFADARYDESRFAREVASRFQTEHHEHIVTPQAREILDTLAYHYDEPFADSSAIPTFYLSRYTRQSVTVALTGDAGDECFAGYDRYRAAALSARFDWLPQLARSTLAAAGRLLPHGRPKSMSNRAYRFLSALSQSPARRYLAWVCVFTPEQLDAGYRPEFRERLVAAQPLAWFDALFTTVAPPAAAQANVADVLAYLPYDLLTKVDIASMAAGLECRSPYLDHELVAFALSLPLDWKLDARGGKRILKDWAADLLPHEIIHRPKMGFGVPVGEWFRNELRNLLTERLTAPDALCSRIFRRPWLNALLDEHLSGRATHEHRLWALLMLELWHDRWRPHL